MMRWSWLVLAFGCNYSRGFLPDGQSGDDGDNAVAGDGRSATPPDAQQCWSVSQLDVGFCLTAPLSGTTTVSSNTSIDTHSSGTGALQCKTLAQGSGLCVIAADTITIDLSRTLTAHGDRPLVLVANAIRIDGTIDVASHVGSAQPGAGANMPGCNAGSAPTNAGGGQGGSFGGKGGDGGNQDNAPGSGGTAGVELTIATLRGGCAGADGGAGGAGGDGGGAVLLIANTITFGDLGRINASGASGRGAPKDKKGGGGAGSGGMIALAAMTVTMGTDSQLYANGGHGGGGSDKDNSGGSGTDPTGYTSGGGGGSAPLGAGSGGTGFPATSTLRDGNSGTAGDSGGGGGGGGAGVIRNLSPSPLGTNVSPPAS